MNPERWRRIEGVFHGAADLSPADRRRFLDGECAGDSLLREHVEKLLEHDNEERSFIDVSTLGAASAQSEVQATFDPRIGTKIGAYRILERIAVGGMGIVYRGQRADDVASYPVAMKVVRREMDSEQILRRFQTERQTLAHLRHPNIARLLDGGVTDDGLPYLVMEFVEGAPIDLHCDNNRLSIRERLKLFCVVCRAVHYAHQNLVVHRDLKPGNILVETSGEPKLLDFGIAKVLEPEGSEPARDRTTTTSRLLTPDYASPEQIRGESVTTSTDVYSLGMVLYGLLTGRQPYRVTSARMDEIQRAICDQPPTRPSSVIRGALPPTGWRGEEAALPTPDRIARSRGTTPDKLRRELHSDLDNIVMTSIRKEPDRRYLSAEQFAADIERFLTGRPVLARKDTIVYRSMKFVRRNRIGVASAALVCVALSASAVISASMAHTAARERDAAKAAHRHALHEAAHARIESDSANEVARILAEACLASTASVAEGSEGSVLRTLDREVERVHRQFADRGHLQANLLDAIGRMHLDLQRFEEAEARIEEAMAIRIEVFGQASLEVARSFSSRGELRLRRGDAAGAEEAFRHAIELHRVLPVGVHTDVASAANNLAVALLTLGRVDEAEALHQEAIRLRQRLLGLDDPLVAESLSHLARVDISRGDYESAEARLLLALDIRRRKRGEDDPSIARTLNDLAFTAQRSGRPRAAEMLYREAIAVLGGQRNVEEPRLVDTLTTLSELEVAEVNLAAEREAWIESLDVRRLDVPARHDLLGEILVGYGSVLVDIGEVDAAEPLLRDAVDVYGRRLASDHPSVEEARRAVRRLYEAKGRPVPAEFMLEPPGEPWPG